MPFATGWLPKIDYEDIEFSSQESEPRFFSMDQDLVVFMAGWVRISRKRVCIPENNKLEDKRTYYSYRWNIFFLKLSFHCLTRESARQSFQVIKLWKCLKIIDILRNPNISRFALCSIGSGQCICLDNISKKKVDIQSNQWDL